MALAPEICALHANVGARYGIKCLQLESYQHTYPNTYSKHAPLCRAPYTIRLTYNPNAISKIL
jgi:hypothetical protein